MDNITTTYDYSSTHKKKTRDPSQYSALCELNHLSVCITVIYTTKQLSGLYHNVSENTTPGGSEHHTSHMIATCLVVFCWHIQMFMYTHRNHDNAANCLPGTWIYGSIRIIDPIRSTDTSSHTHTHTQTNKHDMYANWSCASLMPYCIIESLICLWSANKWMSCAVRTMMWSLSASR